MEQPRWNRAFGIGAVGVLAGAALAGAAGALVGGIALARRAVTPASVPESPVTVVELGDYAGSPAIWLNGVDADLPGKYSFIFGQGAGHARVGAVLASEGDTAVRQLVRVDRGDLAVGTRGRITGWWFTEPEELGFRVEHVTYPTDLGDADAWIVYPRLRRKRRWAVHVHGRGALPHETLRGVTSLAQSGVTSLIISYRNDPGAPPGVRGRYGVGFSESRDVDAAIAEVLRRGAERVTLVGWSMGGTACLVAATRGAHRDRIDGLILDSPAVDWNALLRYHAAAQSVPGAIAGIGVGMLARGWVRAGESGGLPIDELHPETFAAELRVPVLIHASQQDTFVPSAGAERLAALRPDLVQLRLQPGAEHVKLWNVDTAGWEGVTRAFARALPHPPWRG
ncbi:alpha/beta hydrolase family protein [Leucobacter sp. NPDC058333]|uniref:alpha/beta hydrolase family protein n=1 Tax=Leucobacter sp. NPDC058333 TaxID=3346450 RepID=UPI003656D5A3